MLFTILSHPLKFCGSDKYIIYRLHTGQNLMENVPMGLSLFINEQVTTKSWSISMSESNKHE